MTQRTSRLKTIAPKVARLDTRIGKSVAQAFDEQRLTGRRRVDRNARLAANAPLCRICESKGLVAPAQQWDHIIPLWKGGADAEHNLQGLCRPCHQDKTARESQERC